MHGFELQLHVSLHLRQRGDVDFLYQVLFLVRCVEGKPNRSTGTLPYQLRFYPE